MSLRLPPRSARKSTIKPELFPMGPDEVQHRALLSSPCAFFGAPFPSCWRKSVGLSVGRRNRRSWSTFGTSTPSLKRSTAKNDLKYCQQSKGPLSAFVLLSAAVCPVTATAETPAAENTLCHELGVLNADAKAESPHSAWVCNRPPNLLKDAARPHITGSKKVRQSVNVVADSATPRDISQVEAVMDAVVEERG